MTSNIQCSVGSECSKPTLRKDTVLVFARLGSYDVGLNSSS